MPGREAPANFTPLAALPAIVLDFETTGLNVQRDRIIQIGAIAMQGSTILDAPRIDRLVNPGIPIPAASTRIHGLDDEAVVHADSFADCIQELQEALSGRVVLGHHIGFDLAVLRYEAARASVEWHDPSFLDLATLAGAFEPTLPDLGLESLADWLGVEVYARHYALGDCLTTAEAFVELFARLRENDVRTVGQARALTERRSDLLERQERAGWNTIPGDAIRPTASRPGIRLDSQLYSKQLSDVMQGPPVSVEPDVTLRDAAGVMSRHRIGSLLILDDDGRPTGIVTERDILRAASSWADDLTHHGVTDVMTAPVESMYVNEMLYRALGRMARKEIRHLCVVDAAGRAVGMLSQRDLVSHRAEAANALGDAIAEADNAADLAAIHGQLPKVADCLVEDGLGGVEVARVISNEVRALTGRAAKIVSERLENSALGAAPAGWCFMVLGSGGRLESLLSADQDNALIHTGGEQDDPWFESLGSGVAELLDQAGIPLCNGGVMASNAPWRGTVAQWDERIDNWLGRASPEDLLNVDIFFDMVPVAGEFSLARDLRKRGIKAASNNLTFIGLIAQTASQLSPSVGLFGGLPTVNGRIDLKWHGLLPVVSMARVLALRVGSTARSTSERLYDAMSAGRISSGDCKRLIQIHRDVMTMVLVQQLTDLHDGVKPSGRVNPKLLDREERKRLSQDLKSLEQILGTLRGSVSGR